MKNEKKRKWRNWSVKRLLAFTKKTQKNILSAAVPQNVGNYKIKFINFQDSTQLTL